MAKLKLVAKNYKQLILAEVDESVYKSLDKAQVLHISTVSGMVSQTRYHSLNLSALCAIEPCRLVSVNHIGVLARILCQTNPLIANHSILGIFKKSTECIENRSKSSRLQNTRFSLLSHYSKAQFPTKLSNNECERNKSCPKMETL